MQNQLDFYSALEKLLGSVKRLPSVETQDLSNCFGRVLAVNLVSDNNIPAFNNSQVDGYAFRFSDFIEDKFYNVSQRIPAGSTSTVLQPDTIARIFTGAELPVGADSVIMQEDTESNEKKGIKLKKKIRLGENIRKKGCDLKSGEVFFKKGRKLTAADIGMCASVGLAALQVYKPIKVGVFSTGDELKQPGEKLNKAQLYDSNRPMILGLVKQLGFETLDLGWLPDDLESTVNGLEEASKKVDAVLTCGGVSVGEEDHLKDAVRKVGKLQLWQINMKPGKPFAFGEIGDAFFLGMPGNPVSAWVTFSLLCQPFLCKLNGMFPNNFRFTLAKANFNYENRGQRREFLRVRLNEDGLIELFERQNSQVLSSICFSDGLVEVPVKKEIVKGDLVNFYSFQSAV